VQQIANALAPSNFVLTNPEVLRATVESNGDNLVRGMKMLAEDIEAGHGSLRIRQSDSTNLEVGVNMATTPGKVIYQNELMQLIQYSPATENVLRTPLLIVPPGSTSSTSSISNPRNPTSNGASTRASRCS